MDESADLDGSRHTSCLCVLRCGKERKELLKKIGKWQELLT